MTILFVDTETTGFQNERQDYRHPSQPYLVEIGCLLMTDDGTGTLCQVDLIVRPEGYVIPDAAARVHGITNDIAMEAGVPLQVAVAVFTNLRARAKAVVAHNKRFDRLVMDAAIHRTGRTPALPGPDWSCTMDMAEPVLKLPPSTSAKAMGKTFKSPNLGECIRLLFGEELVNAHTALADVRACARVYFELMKRSNGGKV